MTPSKTLVVILFTLKLCFAAPLAAENKDSEAKVIKYENSNDGSGNYFYRYETSNGIRREETGTLVKSGQPDAYIAVEGSVSYTDSEGKRISFKYSADEKGYHVLPSIQEQDDNYPVLGAPEVSPLVVASLLGGG